MKRYSYPVRGFTLVELVVTIILISILVAMLLPRFIDVSDQSRIAAATSTAGAFETSLSTLHSEWLVGGRPASTVVNSATIEFTSNGWPTAAGTGTTRCMEIWDDVLAHAEPIVAFVSDASPDAWSALGTTTFCIFVHQYGQAFSVSNQQPFILYQFNGVNFVVRRFNMT